MTPLHPGASQVPFSLPSGGSYVATGPFRGVLHTTESKDYHPSRDNYYGHHNPPHFTVIKKVKTVTVYQHFSINVAARALQNVRSTTNDTETNRMCAIQIEIGWYASDVANLPVDMKDALRALMRWIEHEAGIQKAGHQFYGQQAAGDGSVARMSTKNWRNFNGWCGHQHVPENFHWDPGQIDIAYLLS